VETREDLLAVSQVAHHHRHVHQATRPLERMHIEHPERSGQGHANGFAGDHARPVCPSTCQDKLSPVMCRALWFTGPGAVAIQPAQIPALDDGDVLVHTTHSGISGGTEMLAYRGELDPDMPVDEALGSLGGTFNYPFQYGYSCVGIVEQSRADLCPGQLVFAFHPHQDLFVAPAVDMIPLGSVDPRLATLLPLVETALQITLDAGPLMGETVAVFGLGTVGALTALLLQRAGARVLAVDVAAWRRTLADELGIDAVTPDAFAEFSADTPVPLVIEASGNPDALAQALGALAHEGTALVASWYGTKQVELPLGANFHRRRLTIRSTQVSTVPAHLSNRWNTERRRSRARDLLDELPLKALATHEFPFDQANAALAAIADRQEGLMHAALGYG